MFKALPPASTRVNPWRHSTPRGLCPLPIIGRVQRSEQATNHRYTQPIAMLRNAPLPSGETKAIGRSGILDRKEPSRQLPKTTRIEIYITYINIRKKGSRNPPPRSSQFSLFLLKQRPGKSETSSEDAIHFQSFSHATRLPCVEKPG